MRNAGAGSLENQVKLKNLEKSKNDYLFSELTPQPCFVCQHPCFSSDKLFHFFKVLLVTMPLC